jgi:hypothetical protein
VQSEVSKANAAVSTEVSKVESELNAAAASLDKPAELGEKAKPEEAKPPEPAKTGTA